MPKPVPNVSPRSYPNPKRQIRVFVVDSQGDPFYGARIEFFLGDQPIGEIGSSPGLSTLELPFADQALTIHVSYGTSSRQVVLRGDAEEIVIKLPARAPPWTQPSIVRCADGTVGQPCANCRVGNIVVRICT